MMSGVVISDRLLNEGEHVVVSTRTHIKVLIGALLVLLVTVFAVAFLAAQVEAHVGGAGLRTAAWVALGLVCAAVLMRWVLRPFLRWYTTTYTFTDRRFMQRSGLIAREGRTIPLNRISGVDFEVGLIDRVFGCGTLIVSDASEQGRVELDDVPHVEQVQMRVAEELQRIADR